MTALRENRGKGGGVPARSRDYYLDAGREYVRRYGADQMTQAAFNPGTAKRSGRPDLVERYYSGREDGTPWPSLNAIKSAFDNRFNNFRQALGLSPNSTGPAGGRRANGEAEPILNVREVRQVIPDQTMAALQRQLAKAERRAERLADELDAQKAKTAAPGLSDAERQKIDGLRKRLADERARRREAARDLNNAVRREERARARAAALSEAVHGDAALLREIDRLTGLLSAAQVRIRELETGSPLPPKTRVQTKTKVVREADPAVLRRIERQDAALEQVRHDRQRAEERVAELTERLANIRQDAITAALKDQRVRTAEGHVRELETQLAQLAEVLIGVRQVLNYNEIEKLRTDGPAGRSIFTAMVKRVAHAQGAGERQAALWDVIAAARNWIDRGAL